MNTANTGYRRVGLEGGISLAQLAQVMSGTLFGTDAHIDHVAIDTRSIVAGDLFIALRGERFDAHDFIGQGLADGAAAIVIDRDVAVDVPVIRVDDTRLALGRLAAWWRRRFDMPVAGITGSNGKTTVKEMLASILSTLGPGIVTRGNLNNEIGVPLTLLHLTRAHRYAVIEMGASRPGDIDYLVRLAAPNVTVVTNAAPAHLAGFGDIAGVARAKGEIFSGLSEHGIAVMNQDDARTGLWRVMAGDRRIIGFGMRHAAEVTAGDIHANDAPGCSFELCTPAGRAPVALRLPGRHNVMNALAAAALAHALDIPLAEITRGLEAMQPVAGRLQLKRGVHGVRVIDDTYNANPGSVKAALEVLATVGADGEKVLVLGDMGELGNASRALHEQIGRQARVIGINHIHAVGELSCIAAGTHGNGSRHYQDHDALIAGLLEALAAATGPVTVLVKGSRSMHMETVVEALTVGPGAGGSGQRVHEMQVGG